MATYDDPFRLRVLKGLTTALEGIMIANGFKHDLAGKVFRGRNIFGADDPLPMLSILETPLPIEAVEPPQFGTTFFNPTWDLLIQGFVDDDKDNPTDPAHVLVADVMQRLGQERKRENRKGIDIFGLGNKVDGLSIASPVVRPADELSAYAQFWLRITLKIVEDVETPYQD